MSASRARALTRFTTAGLIILLAAGAGAASQKATEERLTCQCGCGLTVHTCNHLQCSFAVPVREDIAESLAAGVTPEAIITQYVEEYGEKVLSAPTTHGFNLLAWWGPYIALALGCGALFVTFRRLQTAAQVTSSSPPPRPGSSISNRDRERLAHELEDLDT
jgi:cytochrome c-type biogenesis protein CcmH